MPAPSENTNPNRYPSAIPYHAPLPASSLIPYPYPPRHPIEPSTNNTVIGVPSVQASRKRGRLSLADQEAFNIRIRSATSRYFSSLESCPSVNQFCRENNFGKEIRIALSKLISLDPLLKSARSRWNSIKSQFNSEIAGIISSASKRKRVSKPSSAAVLQPITPNFSPQTLATSTPHTGPASPYWDSKQARNLFCILNPSAEDESDLYAIIEQRAECLHTAFVKPCGWRAIVSGKKELLKELTDNDIHKVQTKARILSSALTFALDFMPELSWNECCKKALSEINECDKFIYFKEPKTVRNWHHKWRIQGESFTNPALIREDGRPSLPPFLDRNPDAKDAIVRHAKAHLHELNVEFLHSYIQKEVLP